MTTYTYPGVYIEEIPSGVHTITGVATSIAAFVGWSAQGPTDSAVLVQSWQDYVTQFGGLDSRSYLGYAVNQFLQNGGQQAYVVRLVATDAQSAGAVITSLTFDQTTNPSTATIGASFAGAWQTLTPYAVGAQVVDSNGNVQTCTNAGVSGPLAPAAWASTVGSPTTDDNGVAAWVKNTAYSLGTLIVDSNGNVQQCTSAPSGAQSGSAPPSPWATAVGTTTSDGNSGLVWTLVGIGVLTWKMTSGGLGIQALNPGQWANNYSVQIQARPDDYTRFSLSLVYADPKTGAQSVVESYANLSLTQTDPRYVVNIVNESSGVVSLAMASAPLSITLKSGIAPPLPSTPASVGLQNGADGTTLTPTSTAGTTGPFEAQLNPSSGTGGINLLKTVPIFNILCVPGEIDPQTINSLQAFCVGERAFLIVDSDPSVSVSKLIQNGANSIVTGTNAINSAFYFPWVNSYDQMLSATRPFPPSGFVAGIYAATDAARNVWKAPAGIDASLTGESGLAVTLTDLQNGSLNTQGINCLRHFPVYGDVVWGSRTLRGNDQVGSEWKYVPIRRFALFLESSLFNGTQWVVFEPNDETLWGQIRLNVGTFLQGLFLQGAFAGSTPQAAYFVKCDADNNPPASVAQGIVNIQVGFAPLYPAEFVVVQIQQIALAA